VLGHAQGEEQVPPFLLRRVSLGHRRHVVPFFGVVILVLDEDAAEDTLAVELPGVGLAAFAVLEDSDVRFAGEDLEGRGFVARGDQHFDEQLAETLGGGDVDRPVDGDDRAEGAHGVAGERLVVGGGEVLGQGAAAWVVVLDDRDAGQGELVAKGARGVQVVEVVEPELAAVELLDLAEQVLSQPDLGVVGGALVWVLPVLEVHDLLVPSQHVAGEVALGLAEPVGDREVVARRALEGFGGEAPQRLMAQAAAARAQLGEQSFVVGVVRDHGDAGVVLGGGADQRRAADVDVLDDDVVRHPAPSRHLLERVEVAHHHVDGLDLVLGDRVHVLGDVTPGEDAAHEAGVHSLDTAVQHLGEAGDLFDQGDGDAAVLEQARGPPGRDELHAEVGEALGERLEVGLVED